VTDKDSVRTSLKTYYISATKTSLLLLFREKIAVYCETHTKRTNALCGQNAEFYYVKAGGTYGRETNLFL
jgi:hypothetical protein